MCTLSAVYWDRFFVVCTFEILSNVAHQILFVVCTFLVMFWDRDNFLCSASQLCIGIFSLLCGPSQLCFGAVTLLCTPKPGEENDGNEILK